jgi:hypothetical protein
MKVLRWMENHKFWTSVILFGIILVGFRIFSDSLTYGLAYLLLLWYTVIGGLVWSGYTRKKGMTFIALGVVIAVMALFPLMRRPMKVTFGIEGYGIIFVEVLLSALLIWAGIRRYKQMEAG